MTTLLQYTIHRQLCLTVCISRLRKIFGDVSSRRNHTFNECVYKMMYWKSVIFARQMSLSRGIRYSYSKNNRERLPTYDVNFIFLCVLNLNKREQFEIVIDCNQILRICSGEVSWRQSNINIFYIWLWVWVLIENVRRKFIYVYIRLKNVVHFFILMLLHYIKPLK